MTTIDTDLYPTSPAVRPRSSGPFGLTMTDRRFLAGALIALLAVRLLLSIWLPFTNSTEARYAEIARKMVETGDWITPQFDYGVPFWGKPPLHTWLAALGMKIFGVGEFGGRILILLSSLGVVALVYGWMRRVRDADQALVAIAVMASSVMFFGASAFVMTDMVMVLGTTLSMVAFYNCVTGQTGRIPWGHLFFAGLAIGLLAKGPVAVVLTGIPIFLWLVTGRRWRSLAALPWWSGLALTAALTLPWYLAAEVKTPGFLRYFIIGEHFDRFIVPGWQGDLYGSGHVQPKGRIWIYAVGIFLPWTLFALTFLAKPMAVARAVRSDRDGWYSYLLFWSLSPLILFTMAANILPAYALPGIPAAALLLTALWAEVWKAPGRLTRLAVGATMTAVTVLFCALAIVVGVSPETLNLKSENRLVQEVRQIDPEMALTYWGGRNYSAEFYTQGQAGVAVAPADLAALTDNGRRDAVAVSPQARASVSEILGAGFEDRGRYGRNILLVERARPGDES